MTSIIVEFVGVMSVIWSFVTANLVPASLADLTVLHVAIWTPVVIGLVGLTSLQIRRWSKPAVAFSRTVAKNQANRELLAYLAAHGASKQRHIRQNTSLGVGDAEAAVQRLRSQGLVRRRLSGALDLTAKGQKAAKTAAREIREQERIEKAAQRAQERAKAAEARQAAEEQARAERASAEQAEKQAQEQARIEKAAQRAQERGSAAAARKAAQEQARIEKAAQRAQERAARPPRPPRPRHRQAQAPPARDPTTRAFGADPTRVYEFRYRVVDLDQLVTSNTDTGAINPAYDRQLQPRQRDRAASQRQIEQVAKNLVPESLLWDFRQLDKGAPIVGDDLQVESGNGRTLALRRAREQFPEKWGEYQAKLRENLAAAGLDESALEGKAAPVLVRERITEVADRAEFAREANAPPVLQMSTLETAMVDSRRISEAMVGRLVVREEQSIDQALRTRANAEFVRGFIGTLSENESALLLRKDGTLAQAGIRRIKAALFVRVFPGAAGERLADTFLESLDSNIKNFETGISSSLPVLVRAEALISGGERNADSLAEDVSKALDMLARLRESETLTVGQYVEQSSMFEKETTPLQDRLLVYFDEIGRSPKKVREFLNEYAAAVESAPIAEQLDLFGDPVRLSKETLVDQLIGKQREQLRKAA